MFYGYIIGESLGYNDDIEYWLEELQFDDTDNFEIVEKEYGYFRVLLDNRL
jgi:hypothetical protein